MTSTQKTSDQLASSKGIVFLALRALELQLFLTMPNGGRYNIRRESKSYEHSEA